MSDEKCVHDKALASVVKAAALAANEHGIPINVDKALAFVESLTHEQKCHALAILHSLEQGVKHALTIAMLSAVMVDDDDTGRSRMH